MATATHGNWLVSSFWSYQNRQPPGVWHQHQEWQDVVLQTAGRKESAKGKRRLRRPALPKTTIPYPDRHSTNLSSVVGSWRGITGAEVVQNTAETFCWSFVKSVFVTVPGLLLLFLQPLIVYSCNACLKKTPTENIFEMAKETARSRVVLSARQVKQRWAVTPIVGND